MVGRGLIVTKLLLKTGEVNGGQCLDLNVTSHVGQQLQPAWKKLQHHLTVGQLATNVCVQLNNIQKRRGKPKLDLLMRSWVEQGYWR